ncbi:MAG: MipA/OmpV family protein [Woeseiaceae bacterium]|jgi:outer membrane scaffolding protein for murein synthesis (MipA/OmpV family)
MYKLTLAAGVSLLAECALAGPILDYIRNNDLNDYAFGVAVSTSQNPIVGAENGTILYPYLTSFKDASTTDDWLILSDGDFGLRWVSDSGDWEIGAVGRVETLGLGNSEAEELVGVADRRWTLEVGPVVGWRALPVHVRFKTYAEVSGRHDGMISQLGLWMPFEWERGYMVPGAELIYQDSDYTSYYYSVTQAEARPTRPAYVPGSATNVAVKLRWGYELSRRWLLSGSFGYEFLDDSIASSPIVDKDGTWRARIGVAYNSDVFQPRDYDHSAPPAPRWDLRIGGFADSISSTVGRETAGGQPGFETPLEDILGIADSKTVPQFDATIRIGHYHRLEFGYFELGRSSEKVLEQDIVFDGVTFPSGSAIATSVDAQIFRAGYSYSLLRDAQKELGFMVGLHITDFAVDVVSSTGPQTGGTRANTPLPVIGAHATIHVGEKTSIGAKAQFFRTDFDRYEGSMNYLSFDIQHRIGRGFSLGLGYNYYGLALTASGDRSDGYIDVRHHGPTLFFSVGY